ncbi:adenylate/guanylate cyclase domain-containing protein [Candidatus Peregrinibacteria bacterium]|nr:adenylate/guanylate cyclase domain-containing protein [Candidatus Peregrinibacteria bacterium]
MNSTRQKLFLGVLVLVVTSILALLNPLQAVQYKISDLFFRGRGAGESITIVAIDDKSLAPEANLGRFKDWPRSYYSQFLRAINTLKPAVVAFDLDFREASRGMSVLRLQQLLRDYERKVGNSLAATYDWYGLLKRFEVNPEAAESTHPDDVDFQSALNENGPVVLVSSLALGGGDFTTGEKFPEYKNVTLPIFRGNNVTVGFANVMRDRDGIVRRFAPWVAKMPAFAVAIGRAYLESHPAAGNTILNADSWNETPTPQIRINYAAAPFKYNTVSFVDALAGRYDPAIFKDKIVLVGGTARILQDFQMTPVSRDAMPGIEINANILQQILDGKNLTEQGTISLLLLLVLFAIGGSIAMFKTPIKFLGILFGGVLFGFPLIAFGAYQIGYVLNVVYPEAAWIFAAVAVLWYRNKTEFKERRMIQKAFSHYVSPIVVNELVKTPELLKLGGKRQQISVLFSDIVGFTSFAEKLTPEDTVALLNDYLSAMTDVVFSYHGTLDKYQGDAIMALYGAPMDDAGHGVNACHTALGMRKSLVTLHEKWNAIPDLPFKEKLIQLDFRVGIATGPAIVGNVGSEKRFDYTAIGDIVNLGSRLESLNKKYGTHIMVDNNTFVTITENHNPFVFRKLDTVRVKGKENATDIFEVVALAENVTSEIKAMLDDFENGRILYTQRNFLGAKQYFESALAKSQNDGPSQIYRNRCNFFIRKPPAMDWSPIVNLEEK